MEVSEDGRYRVPQIIQDWTILVLKPMVFGDPQFKNPHIWKSLKNPHRVPAIRKMLAEMKKSCEQKAAGLQKNLVNVKIGPTRPHPTPTRTPI